MRLQLTFIVHWVPVDGKEGEGIVKPRKHDFWLANRIISANLIGPTSWTDRESSCCVGGDFHGVTRTHDQRLHLQTSELVGGERDDVTVDSQQSDSPSSAESTSTFLTYRLRNVHRLACHQTRNYRVQRDWFLAFIAKLDNKKSVQCNHCCATFLLHNNSKI